MSGERSPAISAGRRNGTSAPNARAISAISGLSVDTLTASSTSESSAEALEYAMRGWPPSIRTFLPGTRFDPARAGISPTHVTPGGSWDRLTPALDLVGVMLNVDGLPIRIDIQRLGPGLAEAVTGVL